MTGKIDAGVCTDAIDSMVDEFMKDKGLNTLLLPDFVERRLYKNVLHLALSAMNQVLDSTHVEFLGHRIEFSMKPAQQE